MTESVRDQHVFLIPGLFGFGKLAGYDYFEHLERALAKHFAAAGVPLRMTTVSTPPTASIPLRATILARHLAEHAAPDSDIHLIGHSTGGLDARLLVTPGVRLTLSDEQLALRKRVRSVVTINTPHHGTPLAGYFTTVAGTRMLYLLSLLTVVSLSVGKLPLAVLSGLLGAVSGLDERLGIRVRVLEQLTSQLLRYVGPEAREQIAEYLGHIKHDQGGIIQLMPEVMELFNATVVDSPEVRYGCIATAAPPPGARRILAAVGRPIGALHLTVYSTVYGFASRAAARYPYAAATAAQARMLSAGIADEIREHTVDGIVPTLSMLWGELLWCGAADHLDIVGHFRDQERTSPHIDWLESGASFRRDNFAAMTAALSRFLLRASS
jgi:triacylglycerol lipase